MQYKLGDKTFDEKNEVLQQVNVAAHRFLNHRPRTITEMRARLLRRFPTEVVTVVIDSLISHKLLDDECFARRWVDSRSVSRPKSAFAVKQELMARGIHKEIAECATNELDDAQNAYYAAIKAARRLPIVDESDFRRRIKVYLLRRGFEYTVIKRAIDNVWVEMNDMNDGTVGI